MFCKKMCFSQTSQENTCVRVSYSIKFQAQAYNFIKKETLRQTFFCEFYEISWNTFLTEQVWTSASKKTHLDVWHAKSNINLPSPTPQEKPFADMGTSKYEKQGTIRSNTNA